MEQKEIQGGAGGGVIQEMALSRNGQMVILNTARMMSNGSVAGRRGHGERRQRS